MDLNRVTTQTYDTLDRLRRITQPPPAAMQPNPVIQLEVNGRDDLTRVIDPRNLATDYAVSGLSNVTSQTSPDTGVTTRTFDAAGNVLTSRDARNRTTTYTYDALHRLTQARYGDGTISTYVYDQGANGVGRLTSMTDPGPITTSWTYTAMGRVATKTQTIGSGATARTHQLTYAYNPTTGQLTSVTYPSGKLITYTYGAATKDLERIAINGASAASSITYHPFGGVKRMTLGNGQVWSNSLDQDGRVRTYTLAGVTYTIAWDAANRITGITSSQTATNRTFGYDNLDRITGFATTGRSQSFAYDATGNLLAKSDLTGATQTNYTFSIAPTSNRMTGISSMGIGYSFDAAGNRTGDGRITYAYNQRGRMNQVRIINGAVTTTYNYLINGINLRVRKTGPSTVVPQGVRIFVYDDAAKLIGEYDDLGRARIEHVWLDDRPIAAITYTYTGTSTTPATTTTSYVETDHLATPRLITNASRQKRWSWESAPYGDTFPNENPQALGAYNYNLRFPGQYFDEETNHHYNHHRDYESTTGRYLQSDPIGLYGGLNTYLYGNADPLFYVDPHGLLVMDDVWAAIYWGTGGWSPTRNQVDFVAGFGDTLSLGLTSYVRTLWDIDGGVDKCSSAYAAGMYAELGVEIGLMGTSFALRAAAKNISQAAARRGQSWHGVKGAWAIHHLNPLKQGLFPTAALPTWVRHSPFNLQALSLPEHLMAHAELARHEAYVVAAFNPAMTAGRVGVSVAGQCECRTR